MYTEYVVVAAVWLDTRLQDLLWVGDPAVSKVIGVGGQRSVGLPEVILIIVVVVSTQSTQLVLIAVQRHRVGMSHNQW